MAKNRLSDDERERYNRQIIIQDFGEEGQLKLKDSHVAIVGIGGLGSPAAIYLTAAGVGRLTFIDADQVELDNLNRQVLHWEDDIGRSKTESSTKKLNALNSNVKVESKLEKITPENVGKLLKGKDIIVDGMDNYTTRFLVNEACVQNGIPFVHGAVEGLIGQLSTITPGESPCLRCILPKEPPERPTFPVLGTTPGVIGCLEAMEAVKLITGVGKPLIGRMLTFDGGSLEFEVFEIKQNPDCPVCGNL